MLCETATVILRVPAAQVNVLDDQFQTSVGKWPSDLDRVKPVTQAVCQAVILANEPVVVENTLLHPAMCMTPLVTMVGVRAYLGVPIYYDDQVVGSFCVGDFEVRKWTHWDISGLQGLARLAGLSVSHD